MNQTWTRYLPAFIREKLEGRDALQKVIGNTGWLFADYILRLGLGFFVTVWVTRYLGPERYGALSYATTFVMIFSSVAMLGLDGIVVRNIVRDPACRDETLGAAFVLKLAGSAVVVGLTIAAIFMLRPADRLTHLLVAIIALGTLFQAFGTIDFWFQSQVRSSYAVYARSASFLAIAAVKVALIVSKAPLVAFAWAGSAEIILGSLGLVVAYRFTGLNLKEWRPSRAMVGKLLRDSWPLMLTDLVTLIYIRIDRIMIGEISGNAELGVYSVAALIAEAFYFIPTAIISSVFPGIVEAKGGSEELFYGRLQQFYNLMALIAYAVALPVTLLAGWGVPFLFGATYGNAAPMLVGLVWAGVFFNLAMARSYYLTAMNWTRLHFIVDFLACGLNVALNFILIPRYGGMGAVIASLVAYWFLAHGSCFLFKPLFRTGAMMTRAMLYPKIW